MSLSSDPCYDKDADICVRHFLAFSLDSYDLPALPLPVALQVLVIVILIGRRLPPHDVLVPRAPCKDALIEAHPIAGFLTHISPCTFVARVV